MKIEQIDGWLNVELTVVELKGLYLKYFHSYEYLCPVVHVVAKMRHRKKSFETIDHKLRGRNDDGPYECDRVVSANTCYQMLKLAGLSQRGMSANLLLGPLLAERVNCYEQPIRSRNSGNHPSIEFDDCATVCGPA